VEGEESSFLLILGDCTEGGSSVGGRLSTFLKNLYPGFLDPPKVGHQGVIKMIKVHFHSVNIRVIIFHKFG
jgi:hypothetical protein